MEALWGVVSNVSGCKRVQPTAGSTIPQAGGPGGYRISMNMSPSQPASRVPPCFVFLVPT